MTIIETPIFTREIGRLLDDDEYSRLQTFLAGHPAAGDLVPGSHGLRKLRWMVRGHGKRGGLRAVYYWHVPDTLFMLYPYRKSETKDLSRDQIRQLSLLVKEWLR